ncbi:MAG: T9SS type A sorting domain-containing protein [Bacteroidales bacterium]
MKKTLLSIALVVLALNARGENLITKGNFQNVTSVTEDGQLLRIANLTDLQTQTSLPTHDATTVETGEWYKKSGANGTLSCKIQQDITLADGALGNGALLKKTGGVFNQNQNCLTTFFTLEPGKEYTLSFDFKPTEAITTYNDLFYVYIRAITAENKLGKVGIGTKFTAENFVAGENGWYHLSRSFKSDGFETPKSIFYVAVDGTNMNYEYLISNVSVVEKTATSITDATENNVKVYATDQTIIVEAENGIAEILDITGRKIKKADIHGTTTIPMEQTGMYIVAVTTAGSTTATKVLIK